MNERELIEEYVKKQLSKFHSRIKTEQDDKFQEIVSQLNRSLNTLNKKVKSMEATFTDEKEENAIFKKKFNELV